MARSRRTERALQHHHRGVGIATAAILLVGLVVLVVVLASPERRRLRRVHQIEIGDTTAHVTELLGPPARVCPIGSLDHLRGRFPTGWPARTVEDALGRMRAETAERWVYPIGDTPVSCTPRAKMTEIGVDHTGRVRWYVAVAGSTRLRLPPDYETAGSAPASDSTAP
jgi:hypothetical protein